MDLFFLKLGGSLITNKLQARDARVEKINALVTQIYRALQFNKNLRLILGHGSGSFGHNEAAKYNTRLGVHNPDEWNGFVEVWRTAGDLNRLVMSSLSKAGIQTLAFPPSACVVSKDGRITTWDLAPIQAALEAGITPVTYGDVTFDAIRGGTIQSTEELLCHLARTFHPRRILLAGLENGVWEDYPKRSEFIAEITPASKTSFNSILGDSAGVDVTGGMRTKVLQMVELIQEIPDMDVLIFSGEEPNNLYRALLGDILGTHIHN